MTTMPPKFRVIPCVQGSIEWHLARAGCISASNFKIARQWNTGLNDQQQTYVDLMLAGNDKAYCLEEAGYKSAPKSEKIRRALDGEAIGDFTEAAKELAFKYAIERISGAPLDEMHQTWQMERGQILEPEARFAHEIEAGVSVKPAGFVKTLDGLFGASADGLIGDDEGSEYKCLVSSKGISKIWLYGDISEFIDQVQGCMWITGRKRWHFAMYCPALKPIGKELYWKVVERDDAYIEALQKDLWRFASMVSEYERILRTDWS